MNYVVSTKANLPKAPGWTVNRPAQIVVKPKQLDVVTRRYEIEWLDSDGAEQSKTIVAPAMQIFEQAFGAFAQGTLIQTDQGYVAIEDLRPGAMIATADGGLQPLMWLGSMSLFPQQLELGLPACGLYRVTDGGYGQDQNAPDLMMGPAARVLPGILAIDSSSTLVDVSQLSDGNSVIYINVVSPVRVFHLGLASHRLIRANGVLAESYHPGNSSHMRLSAELYEHFLALFPHVKSLDDFGPLNHKRND